MKEVNAELIKVIFIKHTFCLLKLDVTFLVYISLQILQFVWLLAVASALVNCKLLWKSLPNIPSNDMIFNPTVVV